MGEPARIAGQPRRPAVAVELDRSLATPARFLVEGRIAALIGLSRGVRSVREQFLGRRPARAVRTRHAVSQPLDAVIAEPERTPHAVDNANIAERIGGDAHTRTAPPPLRLRGEQLLLPPETKHTSIPP